MQIFEVMGARNADVRVGPIILPSSYFRVRPLSAAKMREQFLEKGSPLSRANSGQSRKQKCNCRAENAMEGLGERERRNGADYQKRDLEHWVSK